LTISSKNKTRIQILLILGSFFGAYLCFSLLPNVFEIWNARAVDQLFILRSSSEKFQPSYDSTVVHVDLNNSGIQRLNKLYLNRSHYAKLIQNMDAMGVSAQVFDFIFASRKTNENDNELIHATQAAGSVYFGLAFELWENEPSHPKPPLDKNVLSYLDQTQWDVSVEGNPGTLYNGENPLITYPELAFSARGLGSISVEFDRDGVLRRVPLLVRYQQAYYPLLPLRVICSYLNVSPETILLKPGKHIILRDAKKPGDETITILST